MNLQGLSSPPWEGGKGRAERGVRHVQECHRGTAQLAKQYAMYGLFEPLVQNAAVASGDFIQGQGDPGSKWPSLLQEELQFSTGSHLSLLGKSCSFPSLCPHINTPKHHFLSHGYAVVIEEDGRDTRGPEEAMGNYWELRRAR